eukprot:CAMPEP_0169138528 /NCGR_PEP_ID=MMETSP1015-20121227/42319_1 /TAXON_ID=342587 /ORGANISM="Karlodinium micrum, Strain CCMP2283" /LENGTH=329 /DNA_ID=CAMNT_0009203843 /DNA_START=151 /DNA_END=1140 /DNA_ORIENTATION=-
MSSLILSPQTDRVRRKLPQASRWCAPETVTFNEWSYKTEVWSLGVTTWELFNGCVLPWTNYSKRTDVVRKLKDLAWSVNEGSSPADSVMALDFPRPESGVLSTSAHATVLSCLRPDASARPTSEQIQTYFGQLIGPPPGSQKAPEMQSRVVPDAKSSYTKDSKVQLLNSASPQRSAGERTTANVIVRPVRRASTPAKEIDSWASARADSAALTPSTRCPTALSTPRIVTAGYPASGSALSYDRYSTPDSVSRFSSVASRDSESVQQFQKLLWYSPTWPKKVESLSNIRGFLSCPEAICGLGIDTQLRMRAELSAAEAARTEMSTSTLVM